MLLFCRAVPIVLLSVLLIGSVSFAQEVTLDQADLDYAPGETVYITGTGWEPGEEISLMVINETYEYLNYTDRYAEWFVTADENGNFTSSWNVTEDELNTSLVLTAWGQVSGFKYQVFFSDGNAVIISVGSQSGPVDTGVGGSVTYNVSALRDGANNAFSTTLSVSGLPAGVTTSFSTNPLEFPKNQPNITLSSTLSLTVGSSVPAGNYPFSVTASGGGTSGTGTLTVSGCIAPSFTACPGSQTANTGTGTCDAVVNYIATASGTPAPSLTYSFSGATSGSGNGTGSGSTFNKGVTSVVVTATNTCGTTTCSFTVTVNDNTPPVAIAQDVIVTLDASGNGSTTAAAVNNGSSDACGILSMSLSKTAFTCSDIATNPNVVTLTVTDNNGNSSTATANVTVVDNTPPVAICKPSTSKYVDPYQIYYTVSGDEFDATASDACGIQSLTYSCATASVTSGTSLDGVKLQGVQSHSIVWTAVDNNGNSSTCTTVVTVQKRPTTLTYTGETSVQYSDQVSLSATLIDNVSGAGVNGKTINFTIGTQSTTATTNSSGVAKTTLIITQGPGSYTVKSSFAGDDSYQENSDSDHPFTINQEDARVTFTGTQIVATASATSGIATVSLRATIQDITAVLGDVAYDAFAGDIRNAKVRFIKDGSPLTEWLTPTLVNSSDLKTGIVSYDWSVNIGTATDAEYTIGIEVGGTGYYLRNNSSDNTVVTVYKPTGDFITGGGYIINPSSTAGTYAGDPGLKTNYGFNVKYNKKGTNLQGNMNFIFRRTVGVVVRTYQIKANSMTSLGVNIENPAAQTAVFVSKANLTDITNPLAPVSLGGNLTLQVNMTDKGEPGINSDMIAISLWNGSTLLFSSNWNGTKTVEKTIDGGNLVVHSGFSLNASATTATKEATIGEPDAVVTQPGIKAYPNPFTDKVYFEFSSPDVVNARLELFDAAGAKLGVLFNQQIEGGELYQVEYNPTGISTKMLIYRLVLGDQVYTGKLIYKQQ